MTVLNSPSPPFTGTAFAAVLFLAGCMAGPGSGNSTDEDHSNNPDDPNLLPDDLPQSVNAQGEICSVAPGPGVLRRLTHSEYRASLVSLFGSDVPDEEPLPGNAVEDAYSTNAGGLLVRDLTAQAVSNHADAVAEWVATTNPTLVTSCTELSDACADTTVRTFGRQLFRMPLSETLAARYKALFVQGADFSDALTMTVSTMLQSPYFLYRRELGTPGTTFADLNDYELGTALAFFLTGAPPDAELSATIDNGLLRDVATWDAQITRLLDSPAAEDNIIQFLVEWLKLDLVLSKTKTEDGVELTESLRTSMMEEVRQLIRSVYRSGGGVAELLDGDIVHLNAELAAHYGATGPAGDLFEPVSVGNRTGGLLGTGAYLLGHSTVDSSSPTARGVFIREQLLCLDVPPPPPAVDTDLPVTTEPMTTRDRFAEHLASPACASCHELFDGLGFAFESYDGLGRYRELDNGLPVNTNGSTVGLEAGDQAFDTAADLVSLLAEDAQVNRCFQQNLLEFTSGQADWDNLCSVNQIATSVYDANGSLKDALRSILALPHFQARTPQGAL